jgi:hypothetical protein
MLERRLLVVAVMGALATAPACEKKSRGPDKQLPAELRPTKASVDASKLVAPALFANIPADTPYVVAAFEPVALEYYAKLEQGFGPVVAKAMADKRAQSDGTPDVLDVIIDELGGKLDAKSVEALGVSAQPRFALYGLGVVPVVFRIEIKDEATLRATIERIAQKANKTLPPQLTKDGRAYWRFGDNGEADAVVAILDKQLIVGYGPPAEIDAKLDLILGIQKPAQNMGDGKALIEVMQKHGFGPQLVGYLDTRKLGAQGLAMAPTPPPPACNAAVDALATKVPRVALGYTEISGKRASGGAVVELESGLLAEVAALRTEVPGLGTALSDQPLIAMGGGVDVAKGAALLTRAASAIRSTAETCQYGPAVDLANELADTLSQPIPAALTELTGFAGALHAFEMGDRGFEKLDAFGMVTATSAKDLVALVKDDVPLDQIGLTTDGKLHKLNVPAGVMPEDVYGAVGDKAIVVGTGAKGRALAERGLHGSAAGKSPFLVMSYDYGRLFEIQGQMAAMAGGQDPDEAETTKRMASVFGRATFSADVNDKGVVMWGAFDLK